MNLIILCAVLLFFQQSSEELDEGTRIVVQIKRDLLKEGGDAYWENLKDGQLPWFRAKVVSASPKSMVQQMLLSVEKPGVADVKVFSAKPVCRMVEVGSEVVVRTVAKEFTKKPFLLTLEATAIRGCPK